MKREEEINKEINNQSNKQKKRREVGEGFARSVSWPTVQSVSQSVSRVIKLVESVASKLDASYLSVRRLWAFAKSTI